MSKEDAKKDVIGEDEVPDLTCDAGSGGMSGKGLDQNEPELLRLCMGVGVRVGFRVFIGKADVKFACDGLFLHFRIGSAQKCTSRKSVAHVFAH